MRKTFVSLGLAASVHILPAAAHGASPVPMTYTGGASVFGQSSLPAVAHSSATVQHHAFSLPLANSAAITVPSSSVGFHNPGHPANFNQTHSATNLTLTQVGTHTWAAPQTVQLIFSTTSTSAEHGASINLDLSSTQTALSASGFLKSTDAPLIINVGGKIITVTATTQLTPAEYLAAMAVAAGQPQSLILDARGSAVGGSVIVTQRLGQAISSLVIPQGVTVTDYSQSGSVKVAGDVNDSGNLYLAGSSTRPIALNAANVTVNSGGVITDTFAGVNGSGLFINAAGAVSNAGTIASGASVGLASNTGVITNSGLVSAASGSITLNAPASIDLNITANGGTFKALIGDINIRETNYVGTAGANITGGNYLSNNLNINSGTGTVNGRLGQVSGNVNTAAAVEHLTADSAVLTLGKQSISGDPTYANTGDIDIAGPITVSGANLAIVAGGNVISTSANASITDNGGDVLIIAGGVVSGGSTGGATISGTNPAGAAAASVAVALSGGTGGSIDFSGGNGGTQSTAALAIDTSNVNGSGGNVTLVALSNNAGTNGGSVAFNNGNANLNIIDTHGTVAGASAVSGNVSVFAGSQNGLAIQLSQVNSGGTGTGGRVTLAATQATTDDGKNLTLDAGGNIVSLNKIVAGAQLLGGAITLNGINTAATGQAGGNGGSVSIATAGPLLGAGDIVTSGATNTVGLGGNGGGINISTSGSMSLNNLTTTGGTGNNQIEVMPGVPNVTPQSSGGAVILQDSGSTISVASIVTTGGDGGFTTILSNGVGGNGGLVSISNTAGNIVFSNIITQGGNGSPYLGASAPGGGAGGSITLTAAQSITQNASSTINSSGGNVGAGIAFVGSSTTINNNSGGAAGALTFVTSSNITLAANSSITALGGTAGSGGGTPGAGTTISMVANSSITAGNISSFGNVNLIAITGSITVGNNTSPNVAAINTTGGSGSNVGTVTVSAGNFIILGNRDSSGNVIITGSALIAAGATSGTTIDLDNGNIATAGNTAVGEAWVLGLTGSTTGPYTVNGVANANGFLLSGKQSGSGIIFANNTAPTNFVPGGYDSFISSGSNPTTLTSDNANLAIPIVSSGNLVVTSGIVSNVPFSLYGNSGITFTPSFATSSAPTSVIDASGKGISLTTVTSLNLGQVASLGAINLTSGNSVNLSGVVAGSSVTVNATDITAQQSIANSPSAIISSSTINLSSSDAQSTVGGNFYTGANGSVIISNTSPSGILFINNVTADTPSLALQAADIFLGSPPAPLDIPPFIVLVQNIANDGSITMQNPNGNLNLSLTADIVTSGGSVSFISNALVTNTLTVSGQTNFYGGGTILFSSPQLAFNGIFSAQNKSNVVIDSGNSQTITPMTISTTGGEIATNGGVILIHPTGDLTFATGTAAPAALTLNAAGTNGSGLVNVQGLGNVTLNSGFTLATYSPIQFNMNAGQTITLAGNSVLESFYSGNASFPDPLGGSLPYSILFQNLITNFNIAGTGTIVQNGTVPGNTVFNDFTDVGFADNTNILFQNNTTDPTGNSGFVNFFTRQIQVNGSVIDSTPRATATFHFTQGVNINSNLPSPGPGNFAFAPGDLASSASLTFHGPANVNIGFSGSTPPASIPATQQPLGNFNLGLGGGFNFYSEKDITINTTGTASIFGGSSIQGDSGAISIITATGSNAPIVLAGNISTLFGTVTLHADGAGGIFAAGGLISVNSSSLVTLSSDAGNIGGQNSPINLLAQNVTATTGGNGGVYLSSASSLNLVGANTAGATSTYSVTAPSITLATTNSVTAGSVSFQTANLSLDGTITTQSASASGFTVTSQTPLTLSGAGTIISAAPVTFSANGDLNIALVSATLNSINNLNLTATDGTLTLPSSIITVAQDGIGNGGSITVNAAKVVATGATGPITLDANGAGSGTGDGGNILISITGTAPLVVGGAAGNITASANAASGGGNGGTIVIQNDGNLTVDASKLSITAAVNGNGGSVSLAAGTSKLAGNLVVTGDLHADGAGTGDGGLIGLSSSSKTVMTIGTTKVANGTSGALTANGKTDGAIRAGNVSTGGLTISRALTAFNSIELGSFSNTASSITLNAAIGSTTTDQVQLYATGTGKITDSTKAPITAAQIVAVSGSGSISLTNIVAQAAGTNIAEETAGAIANTNTNANPLIVSFATGAAVTVKSLSAIDVAGAVTGSTVIVETTGKTGGSITINGAVTSSGNITLQTAGNVLILSSTNSTKNTVITASGATSKLTISGNVTAQGKGTIAISVPVSTAINGFDASAGTIAGGGAVTLTASKTNMLLNNVSSGTTIKATASTGIQQTSGLIAGDTGVTLSTTSSTNGTGGITLFGVSSGTSSVSGSTGGAISVIAAGGNFNILENAAISAFSDKTTKAAIILENKLITGATPGSIVVGDGAQITTSGKFGGNIDIVMGPVPGSPKGNILPTTPGVTFTPTTSPSSVIYLGANGVNFSTANGANPIAISAIGSGVKVVLNTGSLSANAITIEGGQNGATTLIQADPPVLTNSSASSGMHTLALGNLPGLRAESATSIVSVELAPTQNSSTFTAVNTNNNNSAITNDAINAISSARTLYGLATTLAPSASDDAPPTYSVRGMAANDDIDAVCLSGQNLGVSDARAGATEYSLGSAIEGGQTHTLRRGALVIAPDKDTTIDTAFGQVSVAAGAVVLIVNRPNATAVFNLDDAKSGSVIIKVGAERIAVAPGRHATITSQLVVDFYSANLVKGLAYRNISTQDLGATNLQAFTGEFSSVHAFAHVKQLREMFNSSNPQAKKLSGHMLKTTAILNTLSRIGQYQYYDPALLTKTAMVAQ